MRIQIQRILVATLLAWSSAISTAAAADTPRMVIEIYRIAPGQHEEFLKFIAAWDQVNVEAGVAPRQLFVHQNGASWDFLLLQPAEYSDEVNEKLGAAAERLGLPRGGKFFVAIRKYIVEHSDTEVSGPTTAAEWLKKLD